MATTILKRNPFPRTPAQYGGVENTQQARFGNGCDPNRRSPSREKWGANSHVRAVSGRIRLSRTWLSALLTDTLHHTLWESAVCLKAASSAKRADLA